MQNYQNNPHHNKENLNIINISNKVENCDNNMEIEITNSSNQLIASGATNYSNNTNCSLESNNININNNSTNYLLYPDSNIIINLQNSNDSNEQKSIFNFKFESNGEYISYAGEYLEEIYSNLLFDEKNLKFKPNFGYMNLQNDINEQMRAILIDWLIEVHYRFRLKNETLFQTVWIIDTYLSYQQITRAKLQLLGIASLLISCKSQEIYYPQLKEFIDITDGAYEKEELVTMENNILKILNFNIVSPTPNDFFNIISKAFNFDQKQNYLGRYFLESALIDYQMIKFSPSVIAVSCAYIVMKYFGISNYKILYTNDFVREECPQKAIKDTARTIYFLVKNLSQSSLKAVKDKYSLSQFLNVAQYCELK
jgi:cyclin B